MSQLYSYVFVVLLLVLSFRCTKAKEKEKIFTTPPPSLSLDDNIKFEIGVVGSGIAGASFIHQIQRSVSENVTIKVYEKEDRIGGRIKKDTLGGGLIEQGATLIHSSNYYLKDIINSYNLQKSVPHGGEGEAETLAIWDGGNFRLNTSRNSFRSSMQMLWAYGMSLSKLSDAIKSIIPKWTNVYTQLGEGKTYAHPKEMFEDLDLYDLTQRTSYDYFKKIGIDDKLVYEFVDCISRVNYHQDGNINAFTDAVSLAGAGLDGGSLFSIEGGNDRLIRSVLMNKSNIELLMNEEVTTINKITVNNKTKYEVHTAKSLDTLDIVVIACPLDLNEIRIPGFDIISNREYQTVHAHFVSGLIDYSYFNNVSNSPQTIFTIENENIPFVSIARTSFSPNWNTPIYKVFSRSKLHDSFLSEVFKDIKGSTHQEWKAYTILSPMKEWPPFKISDGLYYVNAMESAVSAMETQAVASRNTANLCIQYMKSVLQ